MRLSGAELILRESGGRERKKLLEERKEETWREKLLEEMFMLPFTLTFPVFEIAKDWRVPPDQFTSPPAVK